MAMGGESHDDFFMLWDCDGGEGGAGGSEREREKGEGRGGGGGQRVNVV